MLERANNKLNLKSYIHLEKYGSSQSHGGETIKMHIVVAVRKQATYKDESLDSCWIPDREARPFQRAGNCIQILPSTSK